MIHLIACHPIVAVGIFLVGILGLAILVGRAASLKGGDDVAKVPEEPASDPINLPPLRVLPILFADGYRIEPHEIYSRGLLPIVDGGGRVEFVYDSQRNTNTPVEQWIGLDHGVRIS